MPTLYPENWPQFFTATINEWKHLLKEDDCKQIITDCLQFLVNEKRVRIYGFVIMSNHIHIIWHAEYGDNLKKVQHSLTKYTSSKFLNYFKVSGRLKEFEVNSADRKHHFWKRNPLGIELFTKEVFLQKLNYVHSNPVKAGLCKYEEEYEWSSSAFYHKGDNRFNFLMHWAG